MKKIITACAIAFSITTAIAFVLYETLHGRSYAESSDNQV